MVGRGVECQAMATKHRALQIVHDSGDRSFGPQRAARGCRLLCAGFANAWAAHRAIRIYSCRGKCCKVGLLANSPLERSQPQHGSARIRECVTCSIAATSVIGWNLVSLGTLTDSLVHPRCSALPSPPAPTPLSWLTTTQRAFRTPPMNALSDCCTFGLVLASRAVREKKTASKTPYEAFRTARRPPPLSPARMSFLRTLCSRLKLRP